MQLDMYSTSDELLFLQQTLDWKWNIVAISLLLFFIPLLRFFRKYSQDEALMKAYKLSFYFYVLGFSLFLLFFFSLFFPISQYQEVYELRIDKHSGKIHLISGQERLDYVDELKNYASFYVEEKGSKKQTSEVSLLRKDGFMLYLGTYGPADVVSLKKELFSLSLRELNGVFTWYQEIGKHQKRIKSSEPFFQKLFPNIQRKGKEHFLFSRNMSVSPFVLKIGTGILLLAWCFSLAHFFSKARKKSELMFLGSILLPLSFGLGYYFVHTSGSYSLEIENGKFETYFENAWLKKKLVTSGDLENVSFFSVSSNPSDLTGILLGEDAMMETEGSKQLLEIARSSFQGHYKFIRTEGLSVYERILLYDAVVSAGRERASY